MPVTRCLRSEAKANCALSYCPHNLTRTLDSSSDKTIVSGLYIGLLIGLPLTFGGLWREFTSNKD